MDIDPDRQNDADPSGSGFGSTTVYFLVLHENNLRGIKD
jgi:hypothetical protein